MKASEMIERLQKLIEERGDLEFRSIRIFQDYDWKNTPIIRIVAKISGNHIEL